uniref:E3 SUMO-protein ligase PIAS1-like n=1 Tax=Dermatophagoides pteronyssinus TaxID=6956 RepID=A0A6P6XLV7_DERPT|nr:E3 SUMO-protein ligase PIAS1-like [Dermatophagoides pteronyssinus]
MPRNSRSTAVSSTNSTSTSASNSSSSSMANISTRQTRNLLQYNHHHSHHSHHNHQIPSYIPMPNTRSSRSITNTNQLNRTCKITLGTTNSNQLRNGLSSASCNSTASSSSSTSTNYQPQPPSASTLTVSGQYQNRDQYGGLSRNSNSVHFDNNTSSSSTNFHQQQQMNCSTIYSMPRLEDMTNNTGTNNNNNNNTLSTTTTLSIEKYLQSMNVRFIKHNSYEEIRSLIKPQRINSLGESTRQSFRSTMVTTLTMSDQYKVFLRFCKYSTQLNEQMDCLPKSFNLSINECTFTIKNKYTFAPYDITQRIVGEKNNEIYIRATIPEHNDFSNTDYYYGVFLMKKIDHKNLLKLLKDKGPHDTKLSIDLVKKKLFTDDDDVICDNVMKVSLLCPLTSLRLKIPSRSKHCDHVHCFDGEAFISINDITPRWKCPICKIYIKFDDLIIDGLVSRILKNAPTESNEAQIFPDGTFEYLQNGVKINNPNISEGRPTTNLKRNSSSSLCLKNEDKKPRLDSTLKAPKKPTIEWITIDSSDDDDNNKDDDDDDDDDDSDKNSSSDNSDASSSATIISQTDYSNYPRINSSNSSNDCKI